MGSHHLVEGAAGQLCRQPPIPSAQALAGGYSASLSFRPLACLDCLKALQGLPESRQSALLVGCRLTGLGIVKVGEAMHGEIEVPVLARFSLEFRTYHEHVKKYGKNKPL